MTAAALLLATRPTAAQSFDVQVVDEKTGNSVPFATVSLMAPDLEVIRGAALTDSAGHLTVPAPGAGKYRLTIRRVGYRPVTTGTRTIGAGESIHIKAELKQLERVLPTVEVKAVGAERRELEFRRSFGSGRIVTAAQIDSMKYLNLADVINSKSGAHATREIDGWRFSPGPTSACKGYALFLNGLKINNIADDRNALTFLLDTELRHVKVFEIYPTRVSVPPEFAAYVSGWAPCAAIVVWTRDLH